ncbi:MAG: hypothetical protein ACRESR_04725, partial [Gammaproteobacteria bacterium]
YENDTSFEFRVLAPNDERARSELEALWPLKRFPVPADGNRTVARAVDEARPYRSLFPLGAPDRD